MMCFQVGTTGLIAIQKRCGNFLKKGGKVRLEKSSTTIITITGVLCNKGSTEGDMRKLYVKILYALYQATDRVRGMLLSAMIRAAATKFNQ